MLSRYPGEPGARRVVRITMPEPASERSDVGPTGPSKAEFLGDERTPHIGSSASTDPIWVIQVRPRVSGGDVQLHANTDHT